MKGIGIFIVSLLAVIGGAAFAALLIKKKLKREAEVDFDEDYPLHDDDFEEFYDDDFEDDDAEGAESDSVVEEEGDEDASDSDSDDFDDALMQAADAAHEIAKDDDTDVFSGIVFDDIIEEDDAEKPNESI